MLDRLERRAEGYVPVQCPVTFMRRVTVESTRFVDRHPLLSTTLLAVMSLATFGAGVAALSHAFG